MIPPYKKIEHTFKAGDVIFSENSGCDGMYIIKSGQVMVYKTLEGKGGPEEIELARIGPKGIFGEMSLIDKQPRSASVKAVTETRTSLITQEMINQQLSQLPHWVVTLIKLLVTRIRMTNEKLRASLDEQRRAALENTGGVFVIEGKGAESQENASREPEAAAGPGEAEEKPAEAAGKKDTEVNIHAKRISQDTELLLQQLDF